LRVVELQNTLSHQDKLLCKVFHENKKLNLELESASSKIATLRSVHEDMSANPCDNCTMIMVNCADLWLIHFHVTSLLDGASLELRELKNYSTLLGAYTTCPLLRSDLVLTSFYLLHVKRVPLSQVSFSMLPMRTPSFSRRLPI
jgi:hypothetical protein